MLNKHYNNNNKIYCHISNNNKNPTNMQTQYEILQNNQINCCALQEKFEEIKE